MILRRIILWTVVLASVIVLGLWVWTSYQNGISSPHIVVEGPDGRAVELGCAEYSRAWFDGGEPDSVGELTLESVKAWLAKTMNAEADDFVLEDRGEGIPPALVRRNQEGTIEFIQFLYFAENNTYGLRAQFSCPV